MGRKAGLSDAQLSAVIGADVSSLNEKERLVIALADALTATPADVSDELYKELRAHFTEEQLLEISGHIAFENYRARLNRLYQAESDDLYAPKAPRERESSTPIAG